MAAVTFNLQVREVLVGPADIEVQHFKAARSLDDLVEDRVEQLRVDEMAFGFDDLGDGTVTHESVTLLFRHKRVGFQWIGGGSSSMRYSNSSRNCSTGMPDAAAHFRALVGIVEVVAAESDHVAACDGVARGVDIDQSHAGAARVRIQHVGERNRHEIAGLHRDHRRVAAGQQILRRAVSQIARVFHVERNRIGAAQLVADVLRRQS